MRLSRYIKQVLRWIYTYTMRDYAIADVHLLNVLLYIRATETSP